MENKAKPKLKHLNSVQHHHGPTLGDNRRQSNKIRLKVANLGCGGTHGAAAPLVACLEPNLARSVHTALAMMVTQVLGRFNVPIRRFAPSIRG